MMKLLRQGGRTVCVVALLAALSPGCSATRAARVAQKSPVEVVSGEPTASTDGTASVRSSLASTLPAATEASSLVIQTAAADDAPGETAAITDQQASEVPWSGRPRPDEGVRTTSSSSSCPLDLGGVLGLADGQNPQVILARERINEAYAQVDRADFCGFLRCGRG